MKLRVLLAAVALLAVAAPAAAQAADTHAPKGARLDWLPSDEWVMSSWSPFDEARLNTTLKTDRDELRGWLDDHRTLWQLARKRGVKGSVHQVARRLVGARATRTLVARAEDMLTQAHLSHHVLFHVFHTPAVADHARTVFGVSPATYKRLRNQGHTPAEIGATGGRTGTQVTAALARLFAARDARGVKVGAMSKAQGAALQAEQAADLARYVQRHYRTSAQQLQFLCGLHA